MSDKFIYVKRSSPFVHDQINSEEMQQQLAETSKSIGSYFANKDSAELGSGLTPTEKQLLICAQLGISVDLNFHAKVQTFYTDIYTKIPGGKVGLKLNIGLEDNAKPLSATNMPVKLIDYIKYRHIIGYPNTALSPEAAKGNSIIEYYIEDPTKVLEISYKNNEIKDKAMSEYLRIKDDVKKANMVLHLMKGYIKKVAGMPPVNINNLGVQDKILQLKDLSIMRPEKFYEVATDEHLSRKFFVEELLDASILTRIGTSIVDVEDSNTVLGQTVEETLMYISRPTEGQRLNRLRSKLDIVKQTTSILA